MRVRIATAVFLVAAVVAFVFVAGNAGRDGPSSARRRLSEEEIERLFPCVCYPGQASGPGAVRLLAEHSDVVVLARVEKFDFAGFDSAEIEWTAVLRTSHALKGQGEPVYRLAIASPARNFGLAAEGGLFLLFLRESGEGFSWALEPWLPENEDIAAGSR